jgi:hypothetical protein
MTRPLFPVFSRITKNGLSPAYSKDAELLPENKIYDMGKKEYNGLIVLKLKIKFCWWGGSIPLAPAFASQNLSLPPPGCGQVPPVGERPFLLIYFL